MSIRKGRLNFTEITEAGLFIKKTIVPDETRIQRLKREQWALLVARSRGVNVPTVIDYYIDPEQREVLVLKKINAKELTFYPNKFRREAMSIIGSQMLKLNSVSTKFGWPHPDVMEGEYNNWGDFLYSFTKIYGERIVNQGVISKETLFDLLRAIKMFDFQIKSASLIHRDIKLGNILCTHDSQTWIVDWENALLGDALFDIATYGANYGRDYLWEALAEGLKSPVNSQCYRLYEVIALIGTIDFYKKQGLNYQKKKRYLDLLIKKL